MKLTDILKPECVKVPLQATSKQDAIFELVDLLGESAQIKGTADLKEAIWQREQTRTTGIGHGIAIPHGKSAGCAKLCMAVGQTKEPIDFGAIDGKPVELILLLASPVDQTGPHIQALASISRMLTNTDVRNAVKTAPDVDTLYQLVVDHDAKV